MATPSPPIELWCENPARNAFTYSCNPARNAFAMPSLTAAAEVLHRDCSCKPWLTPEVEGLAVEREGRGAGGRAAEGGGPEADGGPEAVDDGCT